MRSLFWSQDGINFEPCCEFPNIASGIFSSFIHDGSQTDVTKFWGVAVNYREVEDMNRYIYRFDFEFEE